MTLPNVQEHAGAEGAPSPYRWVILFIAWIAFLLSFIDRLAWANVAVSVGESLGLTVAVLGVFVTAFYVFITLAVGPLLGTIAMLLVREPPRTELRLNA